MGKGVVVEPISNLKIVDRPKRPLEVGDQVTLDFGIVAEIIKMTNDPIGDGFNEVKCELKVISGDPAILEALGIKP